MCDPRHVSRRAPSTIPRPRWAGLYATAAIGLAALVWVATQTRAASRPTLESVVAGGVLVAFMLWIRANRAALDQQDWCACAAETLTVRVIPSRLPRRGRAVASEPHDHVDGGDELHPTRLIVVWSRVRGPVHSQLGTDQHAAEWPVRDPEGDLEEVGGKAGPPEQR
jgi:hypothetical protein